MDYISKAFDPKSTPQQEQARADQVVNNAGGFVFPVDDITRARRFLILGSEGGTYYQSEKELTRENAKFIMDMANSEEGGKLLLTLVTDISLAGRAPKQNPTLFALAALCCSESEEVRRNAYLAMPSICRTGTMLFTFVKYMENIRGTWPMGLRKAVARWYEKKSPRDLAYQVTKYGQREGWTHRDLLRLSHPGAPSLAHTGIYNYITKGEFILPGVAPRREDFEAGEYIGAIKAAKASTDLSKWVSLAETYKLSWEQLPDAALSEPAVWDVMVPNLGLTALVRNLGRLSKIGYLAPLSDNISKVVARLSDPEQVKKSRIHPLNVLVSSSTYAAGRGIKGRDTWTVVPQIAGALEEMFYTAFGNVEPTGKKTLIGLDVSGSMGVWTIAGTFITPRAGAAALALVSLRTEPNCHVVAFQGQRDGIIRRGSGCEIVPLPLTPQMSLGEVMSATNNLPFGATDCAAPMMWALANDVEVETFVVITDNETWFGNIHPFEALRQYRRETGIPARLAVLAMTSTGFSIADPSDAGCLDLVGFDSATPEILRMFSVGEL